MTHPPDEWRSSMSREAVEDPRSKRAWGLDVHAVSIGFLGCHSVEDVIVNNVVVAGLPIMKMLAGQEWGGRMSRGGVLLG